MIFVSKFMKYGYVRCMNEFLRIFQKLMKTYLLKKNTKQEFNPGNILPCIRQPVAIDLVARVCFPARSWFVLSR